MTIGAGIAVAAIWAAVAAASFAHPAGIMLGLLALAATCAIATGGEFP